MYRVQHNESQVTYEFSTGFKAKGTLDGDHHHLRKTLNNSLVANFRNHCNKIPISTALISICSSPERTLERAHVASDSYERSGVRIYEIHVDREIYCFHAQKFAKDIKRKQKRKVIARRNWYYLGDEYLVINNIPGTAVRKMWSDLDRFADYLTFNNGTYTPLNIGQH